MGRRRSQHVVTAPACVGPTFSQVSASKHARHSGSAAGAARRLRRLRAEQGTSCRRQSGPRCPWPARRGPLQQQRCPPGLCLQGKPGKRGGRQAVRCLELAVKKAASRPAAQMMRDEASSTAGRQAGKQASRQAGRGCRACLLSACRPAPPPRPLQAPWQRSQPPAQQSAGQSKGGVPAAPGSEL